MQNRIALLGGDPVRTAPFPAWPITGPEEEEALRRVLASGHWGLGGGEIERFERDFARYQGTEHGICVTSGTVALRIALIAAGIGAGDEVILPAYTFQATATAVVEANATPVFVDVSPDTYTIDPYAVERAITPRTKAILPVHFAGLPADMDGFSGLAIDKGITVIEDAAQAHGAEYKGVRVGSYGQMGCFSFQSSKNLNCGEGGIIVTSDPDLAERCRAIRNCGRADMPGGLTICGNYRITEFQGAILNAQFARLDAQMARRDANALCLAERLADVPGITAQRRDPWITRHAYHLFSFRYDEKVYGVPRRLYLRALNAEGIPATEGYTEPLYRQPLFAQGAYGPYTGAMDGSGAPFRAEDCSVAKRACAQEGAWMYQRLLLGPESDVEDIFRAFEKLYALRDQLREAARESEATQ